MFLADSLNIGISSTQTRFQVYDQVSLGVTYIKRLMVHNIKPHLIFLFLGKLKQGRQTKKACFKLQCSGSGSIRT